jgi:hypothetical protein
MDIDRFRFGSAVALGLLPLSLVGMAFGQAPLAALIVAALFAIDFPLERGDAADGESSQRIEGLPSSVSSPSPSATSTSAPAVGTGPMFATGGDSSGSTASTDGGVEASDTEFDASADDDPSAEDDDADDREDELSDAEERAPWL